jgi:hypothetical protein
MIIKQLYFPLVISLACAATAHAQQAVSFQDTFSFVPDASKDLSFPKFDPALGMLTGVTISIDLTKSGGSLMIDNDSLSEASGNIMQTVGVSLSSETGLIAAGGFTAIPDISITSIYFATVAADDGDGGAPDALTTYQPGGPDNDGTTFATETKSQSSNVNPLVFSQFIGTDNVTITANGFQNSDTTTMGGASFAGGPATACGTVTVTYTFAPLTIPEPSSALLGAVGALGLLRRRR